MHVPTRFDQPLRYRRSTYDIVYNNVYDIVYDIVNNVLFIPFLNSRSQDTFCLVASYPFHLEPLDEFDLPSDFDITGGDDVWFAGPQLFFRAACARLDR
jgi:hypothetical protein